MLRVQNDAAFFSPYTETVEGEGERVARGGVTLIGTDVVRRDLIDIGFGVDETFEDLVPAGK